MRLTDNGAARALRLMLEGTCLELGSAKLFHWYRALEGAGVEFIDESSEHGPSVRLQKGKGMGEK